MSESYGVRSMMLSAYALPRWLYVEGIPWDLPDEIPFEATRRHTSAAYQLRELGCRLWAFAGGKLAHSRKKRIPMDMEKMVEKWKTVVVGLATAHSKDEADRYEAAIDDCLTPILAAPVKQIRQFAAKLARALEADPKVPLLVHRAFTIWTEQMKQAPDEDVKLLKTDLAKEIVEMVEDDAKRDLPAAMIHALQWRNPEQLQKVKQVVESEKAAGRGARLKGRESCLFLEIGAEDQPEVCIQI